jgi:hypothetical protein
MSKTVVRLTGTCLILYLKIIPDCVHLRIVAPSFAEHPPRSIGPGDAAADMSPDELNTRIVGLQRQRLDEFRREKQPSGSRQFGGPGLAPSGRRGLHTALSWMQRKKSHSENVTMGNRIKKWTPEESVKFTSSYV